MAKYYADNGLKRSDPGYRFVGWDEIGGEVTEATLASKLGMRMPDHTARTFEMMAPGTSRRMPSGAMLEVVD